MNGNDTAANFVTMAFQRVVCRTERKSIPEQVKVGDEYYLDRLSIYLDVVGDAYGVIYTDKKERIAQMLLSHFTSVYNENI